MPVAKLKTAALAAAATVLAIGSAVVVNKVAAQVKSRPTAW